jgi:hypothetical protein
LGLDKGWDSHNLIAAITASRSSTVSSSALMALCPCARWRERFPDFVT